MSWQTRLIVFSMLLLGCAKETAREKNSYHSTKHLIGAKALLEIFDTPPVKILDIRRPSSYDEGHIKSAVSLWRDELEDTTYSYGGMRPSRPQLIAVMAEKGINTGDYLVLYDNNGACEAARVWWVLKLYGYENVAILNGGLAAWKAVGGTLTKELSVISHGNFTLPESPENHFLIERQELLSTILNGKPILVDTRSTEEYSGNKLKDGASRKGRIPGSIHIDWVESINYEGDMTFKSITELKEQYKSLIKPESEIVVYCHSGVRSAHTFFVLTELIGIQNVRNFDGSWIEWSHDQTMPIETDSPLSKYK